MCDEMDNISKTKKRRNRRKRSKETRLKRSGLWVSREAQRSNINSMLPPEILEKIFHFLGSLDVSNVMLVCRLWRDVGEAPWLWAGHNLRATPGNLHIMPKLLTIRRIQAVRKLKMDEVEVSNELIEAIMENQGIKELECLLWIDLSSVEPKQLTKAVIKLEKLYLDGTNLNSQQTQAIFMAMGDDSNLKKLHLWVIDLASVEPKQLAKAVIKLEELVLSITELNSQQSQAIFTAIGDDSNLKILSLRQNNLSSVDSKKLAKAVIKLEELDLSSTQLNSQQTQAIFTAMGDDSNLRILDLWDNDLSSVEPKQLANSVIKLKELDLSNTDLNSQQMKAIFTAIGDDSNLKKLSLRWSNLSSLEPKLIAKAVIKLEELDLGNITELNSQQTKAIFMALGDDSNLKKLHLWVIDLSSVEPKQLAKAVIKLEELDLGYITELNSQQTQAIFTAIGDDSNLLKKLSLGRSNLSSVEPKQLAKAVIKLEELDLGHITELNCQQTQAIFTAIGDDSNLKKLSLGRRNLSSVEPKQVAKAVIKLEELDLTRSELNSQQKQAIFTAMGDDSNLKRNGL